MGNNSRRRHADNQRRTEFRSTPDEPVADDTTVTCIEMERAFAFVLREGPWKNGWQPDELLRHVRRSPSTTPGCIDLLVTVMAVDAAYNEHFQLVVHPSWRRQSDRICAGVDHEPDRAGWFARWLSEADDDLSTASVLLEVLLSVRRLPRLIPPPGSSGCDVPDLIDADDETSAILSRIRALLAKAESTEYPAEAEAFTAKAQSMMFDERIDEATVRARSFGGSAGRASAIRIPIDEPYVNAKATLLHAVAKANDARSVLRSDEALATVVGPVGQLAHIELLFTSLLIQVQTALSVDAAAAPAGSRSRNRGYRSSFLFGFAFRIGARLQSARDSSVAHATGDALPVLAADEEATTELFQQIVGRTSSIRSARYDLLGASAGQAAADRAALRDAGLVGSSGPSIGELPAAG